MPPATFQHYVPKPPLSQFVGVFWYWEGYDQKKGREHCLPSGTTELVISLRDLTPSGAVISGARSDFFILERSEQDCLFGIHFNPGGAFPFLRVPSIEIADQNLTLDDLWPGESERLQSLILKAPTVAERFSVMENWLLTKLTKPMVRHPAVHFALEQLTSQSNQKTAKLADEVNLSQRRFIEIFKNQVGLSPKRFGRVMRFQEIIKALGQKNEIDWLDVSLNSGYFDQAHFNHDFKEFSGLTPTEYLSRRTGHLNHVRI